MKETFLSYFLLDQQYFAYKICLIMFANQIHKVVFFFNTCSGITEILWKMTERVTYSILSITNTQGYIRKHFYVN